MSERKRIGARKKVREPLSHERIVAAAFGLADRRGLAAFSTRLLAEELGCEAMSIYHYFPSKAHLFDAMVDRCMAEIPVAPSDENWIERLRKMAFGYRAMALRHPGFYPLLAVHRLNTRAALGLLDQVLRIFEAGGLSTEARSRQFRILGYYLTGACLDETAGYAKGPSAAEPVPGDEFARDFPSIAAVGPFFQPQHHLKTFEAGLEVVLAGIRASREK
jgi:AcrR family transcriptional regulator